MNTTELIELLKSVEFGARGRPREISISYNSEEKYFPAPDISISSTGDGVAGAEMCLELTGEVWEEGLGKESERRLIAEEYAQSNNLSIVSNELLKDLRNDGQKAARYETAIFLAILLLLLCAVVIVGLLT